MRRGVTASPGAEVLRLAVWAFLLGILIVTGMLYGINAVNSPHPWINHDVGYHTYLGMEMNRGLRLYVDLKEDNPPGNPLLLAALFVVGDRLGLPDFLTQNGFVLVLAGLGLLVLRSAFEPRGAEARWGLVALAYLLVAIRGNFSNSLYAMAPGLPYDFGQREHLFALLFLPYLFWRISGRPASRLLPPYLVLLGAVSTFKPFWPPMIVVVEAYALFGRNRPHWHVPLALAAGMGLPFALLLWHSRESFATFWLDNVPTYFRGGYTHYDTSLAEFATSRLHLQMVAGWVVLLAAGAACLVRRLLWPGVVGLLVVLAAIAYGSVMLQHKFWSYHAMVFFGLAVVPAAYFLASIAAALGQARLRRALIAMVATACVACAGSTLRSTERMLRQVPPLGYELVPLIRPYARTMFFSLSVVVTYAPLRLRRDMVGPWTVLLDLPELMHLTDPLARKVALDGYARRMGATIEAERPDLLVFSPESLALPEGSTPHEVLSSMGLVPRPGYRRMLPSTLEAISPARRGWVVYERIAPREVR